MIGKNIKRIREQKQIPINRIAEELGISISTAYRYENSSISKIKVSSFNKICEILEVSPSELMNNSNTVSNTTTDLPLNFITKEEAMQFLLKQPAIAAYGGYDINDMSPEMIIEFANDLLTQLNIVSNKYKLKIVENKNNNITI